MWCLKLVRTEYILRTAYTKCRFTLYPLRTLQYDSPKHSMQQGFDDDAVPQAELGARFLAAVFGYVESTSRTIETYKRGKVLIRKG